MRIALVHDFLKEYGGAERVLEVLHEIWPEAPIYTSFVDYDGFGPHQTRIKKWQIVTSWAQKIPYFTKIYSPLRFLAPYFFESFNFSGFDVVISSTNAYYAKGIITKPETMHVCYCHTPPRSLYGYPTRLNWQKNVFTRIYGNLINHFLRQYDYWAAQRVDFFVANSEVVKQRIKKFYRRDAVVIYPPVELADSRWPLAIGKYEKNKEANSSAFTKVTADKQELTAKSYYLYVGKLAAAKNVKLAIEAALKMGLTLKIAGKGGEERALRIAIGDWPLAIGKYEKNPSAKSKQLIAKSQIEFLGEVSDEELRNLYQNCRALLYPAVDEDFGIVPVEAMSFGKPVVAFRSGGVVETVVDGKTGVFFDEPTVESLVKAVKRLQKLNISPEDCRKQAEKFNKEVFKKKMRELVERVAVGQ